MTGARVKATPVIPPAPIELAGLESALGHAFAAPGLLVDALTHPSLAGVSRTVVSRGERVPGQAYERLEFLGDRVLGLAVAEWLLERFPEEREGNLARRHASLVRREALAVVADAISLGHHLRLSPGEQECGGRANLTILADACEAVIGALYLDGGWEVARRFVRQAWEIQIDATHAPPQDGKTALQEWAQGQGKPLPVYEIVRRSGPAHEPEFEVAVRVEGYPPVHGTGRSRRLAETIAARGLLRQLGHAVE